MNINTRTRKLSPNAQVTFVRGSKKTEAKKEKVWNAKLMSVHSHSLKTGKTRTSSVCRCFDLQEEGENGASEAETDHGLDDTRTASGR